ncbi:MAG: TIGR01459 family HAD-type hydrolase [Rubricella sp.]
MTQRIESLADIAGQYDALYCDLWGCLHNGIEPFPEAVAALRSFVADGGSVILLTNSPKPKEGVAEQLAGMGVPGEIYHGIASSGDAALAALASGLFGRKVWHLGPERDVAFFERLDIRYPGHGVTTVPLEEAEGIVCTGPFNDETETPDDYRREILYGVNEGLKMLCANPDIFVDRGDKRIWCAGGIARAYEEAGGDARYFGKPHAPIYDLARTVLTEARGEEVDSSRILCIGDGIATDIAGGIGEGLDTLFIAGGLAREDTMPTGRIDEAALRRFTDDARISPRYAVEMLR